MHWVYYVGKFSVRVLLFLLTRWRVTGRENVPRQGSLLVVANPLNLADPPVVGVSLGRKAMFMAKEELFRSGFSRYFVRNFGAFPVRRGGLDRKALQQAQQCLEKGLALVMFPEGRRSKAARLQPGFFGSALIALRNGVPILPVGISGTENIRGVTWWLKRPRITVNIGQPFYLPKVDGKLNKAELARHTASIMAHIAELLPGEYRASSTGKEPKL